jgi:hypothetical protein
VAEQLAQRYRDRRSGFDSGQLPVAKPGIDVFVERQSSAFDKLESSDRGQRLADRGSLVKGIGDRRCPARPVGHAKGLNANDMAVVDDRQRNRCYAGAPDLFLDVCGEAFRRRSGRCVHFRGRRNWSA